MFKRVNVWCELILVFYESTPKRNANIPGNAVIQIKTILGWYRENS